MSATIVTALYDIGREKIDGRDMRQYYDWFAKTLQFQCPMVIYCETSHIEFIRKHRPAHLQTKIVEQALHEIPYYFLKSKMDAVLADESYKLKIADPNRIECKTSLYSIIQYSKFPWVQRAAKENHFCSDYFFWLDAGASRFIPDLEVSSLKFPGENFMNQVKMHPGKILYQMYVFPYTDLSMRNEILPHDYLYDNRSYVWGGMFGVDHAGIENLKNLTEHVLVNEMLEKNLLNNEQIAVGFILPKHKDEFIILQNDNRIHRNFELIYQAFA